MSWLSKQLRKAGKWVDKKIIKPAVKFIGNLFGFNITPDIPKHKLDPTDLGAPKVGHGHYIPQFIPNITRGSNNDHIVAAATQSKPILIFSASNGENNKYLHLTYLFTSSYLDGITIWNFDGNDSYSWEDYASLKSVTRSLKTGQWPGLIGSDRVNNKRMLKASNHFYAYCFFNNGFDDPEAQPNQGSDSSARFDHLDTNVYTGLAVVKIRYEAPDPNANLNPPPFTGLPELDFELTFAPRFTFQRDNGMPSFANVMPPWIDTSLTNEYTYPACISIANQLYMFLRDPVNGAALGYRQIGQAVLNSDAGIDKASFVRADEYLYGTNTGTGAGGIIRLSDQSVVQNIKDILYMMQANLVLRDGYWTLKPDPNYVWYYYNATSTKRSFDWANIYYSSNYPSDRSWQTVPAQLVGPTVFVNENDIIDGITLEGPKADQKYTNVILEYIDSHLEKRSREVRSDVRNLILDNRVNYENVLTVNVPGTQEPDLLKDFLFFQSHYSDKIQLTLTPEHIGLEPGDLIGVTFGAAQLDGNKFVVMTTDVDSDYSVRITAKRYLGDISRTSTLTQLLAATKNNSNTNGKYDKNILNVAATAGLNGNSQITNFISSPLNLNPFTDFNLSLNGSPAWISFKQYQRLALNLEGYEPSNTRFSVEIKAQGEPFFKNVNMSNYVKDGVVVSRLFADIFEVGQTYQFKVRAYSTANGYLLKEQEKSYTVPGNLQLLGSTGIVAGTRSAVGYFEANENKPFGLVVGGTGAGGNVSDDSLLTWEQLDPTSGQMTFVDETINGIHRWGFWSGEYSISPGDPEFIIPWSHIAQYSSNYGVTSAIAQGSYTHPSAIDLGSNTDFWWTASADHSPEPTDVYIKDTWYGATMVGAYYSFQFDVDGTNYPPYGPYSSINQTLASPLNGRYVTPIMWVIAKGGGGEQVLGLQSYNVEIHTDNVTTTLKGIDTSTLPAFTGGGVGERTVDLSIISPSTRFGKIQSISIVSASSETQITYGKLAAAPINNTNSFDIEVRNLSGTLVDAVVDITIVGFPEVKAVLDADGDPTAFVNNFTGEI